MIEVGILAMEGTDFGSSWQALLLQRLDNYYVKKEQIFVRHRRRILGA